MLLEIYWNDDSTTVDLVDGTMTVGGSPDDHIYVAGLPHRLLKLELNGDRVTVRSIRSVRIGSSLFPANVPRLVLAGERLVLPNDVVLRRPEDPRAQQRKTIDTAHVMKDLLAGDGALDANQSRAASLTCLTGLDAGTTWPLAFSSCVIGRAGDVEVRIRDMAVSRRHAKLTRRGKDMVLTPIGTTNGVFINGQRLRSPCTLGTGDCIELGQSMLRYCGPERAPEEETVAVSAAALSPRRAADELTGSHTEKSPTGPGRQEPTASTTEPSPVGKRHSVVANIADVPAKPSPEARRLDSESSFTPTLSPPPRRRSRVSIDGVLLALGALVAAGSFALSLSMLR